MWKTHLNYWNPYGKNVEKGGDNCGDKMGGYVENLIKPSVMGFSTELSTRVWGQL